jgi:hypothetical protein
MKNRLRWAALLARTFNLDLEACNRCGDRVRIITAVIDAVSIKRYLDSVGLPLKDIGRIKHLLLIALMAELFCLFWTRDFATALCLRVETALYS